MCSGFRIEGYLIYNRIDYPQKQPGRGIPAVFQGLKYA
jgi:hypothetical protein